MLDDVNDEFHLIFVARCGPDEGRIHQLVTQGGAAGCVADLHRKPKDGISNTVLVSQFIYFISIYSLGWKHFMVKRDVSGPLLLYEVFQVQGTLLTTYMPNHCMSSH